MLGLFTACATQWRHAGMGGARAGLDYAAVRSAAAMMRMRVTPELFEDLRVMEAEALRVWARRKGGS